MTSTTCFPLFISTKVYVQSQIFFNLVTNDHVFPCFIIIELINHTKCPTSLSEGKNIINRSRDPHLTRLKTAIPNNFLVIINNVLEKPTRTSVIMIHVQKGVINLKYSCLHIPVTVYISGLFCVFVRTDFIDIS